MAPSSARPVGERGRGVAAAEISGGEWWRSVAVSGGGPAVDTRRDGYTVLDATTYVYRYHIATCGNILYTRAMLKTITIILLCVRPENGPE